jgi:hypothetical protein
MSCGGDEVSVVLAAEGLASSIYRTPVPLSGIAWFAFSASSEIVAAEDTRPRFAGTNSTVSLHSFFGNNRRGQLVADPANPNTCGLVTWTENATGLLKVIGGPSWAELLSVNVTDFSCPTFTLPKFPDGGLIFKFSGTGVGEGFGVFVGVGDFVLVAVAVGVFVGVTVFVAVAVRVELAVAVPVAVAVFVAVAVAV